MAKPGAFNLAFRISSVPPLIPTQSKLGCSHLILNRRTHENLQFLGPINCLFLNSSLMGARRFSSSISKERSEKPLPWLAASMERKERKKTAKKEVSKGVRSSWEVSAEKFLKSTEISEVSKFDERRNEFRSKDGAHVEDEAPKFERRSKNGIYIEDEVPKFDRRNEFRSKDGTRIVDEAPNFERRNEFRSKNGVYIENEAPKFDRRNEFRSKDGTYIEDEAPKFGRRNEFRSKNGIHIEDEAPKFGRRNEYRSEDGARIDNETPKFGRRNEFRRKSGNYIEDEAPKFGRRNEFRSKDDTYNADEEEEVVNDPRWYNIKKRYDSFMPERADVRRWNNQENWGKKTWKEGKESTLPKIVGEGVYGVGPVLAALSAGRREFYSLYIQEGLDLSSNNRKKKDKKGFEKVLKVAEKIGLSTKEVPKHDLNMVADNRPHQGLVLDASPLEMVSIKELEPVVVDEGEKGPLWLALDEVTDPQNLGAIIRSAYFFGACGVVLCAKNSAPLSGVVSKASAGSLELMELRACKNMMQFLTSSGGNGWRVLGGSVSARAVPLSEIVAGAPTILVLGSEGTGLRPLVERSCSQLVRIPGNLAADLVVNGDEDFENGGDELRSFLAVESLNVSVAAGVMLNHLIG